MLQVLIFNILINSLYNIVVFFSEISCCVNIFSYFCMFKMYTNKKQL